MIKIFKIYLMRDLNVVIIKVVSFSTSSENPEPLDTVLIAYA